MYMYGWLCAIMQDVCMQAAGPLPAGTLKQWGVTNNDLFYVFVRREDQPDSPSPQGLLPLDHNSGEGMLQDRDALQYRGF